MAETPQIHLHGCIIILGGLEQPNGADPLAKMLNTVGQAVTQSYIRAAEPVHIQVEPPRPAELPRLQEAAPAARPSSPPAKRARQTKPAQPNTCPICGIEIGPTSIGCRHHYQQVKKARRQAARVAELAREYDEALLAREE